MTTRLPRYVKCLQLERRLKYDGVDRDRIHKSQTVCLALQCVVLKGDVEWAGEMEQCL